MKEEYQKQRYTVWLSKDAIQKSDAAVTREDFANRSAFIERAIHFYSGYLYQESHQDFLSEVMLESMKGIVKTSENHLVVCFSKSPWRWRSWKVCLLPSTIWMRQPCADFTSTA